MSEFTPKTKVNSIVVAGAGYTGERLLRTLSGKTNQLIGLSRSKHLDIPGVEFHQIDLDATTPDRIDAGANSLVCYLVPPATDVEPESRIRRFLEEVLIQPPDRLLLISTTGVYGDCHGEWVNETRPINPQTERAQRRAKVEEHCQNWASENEMSLAIFRVAGIYGPGRVPVERLRRGFSLPQNQPDGFSNRIHVDDLMNACVAGLLGTSQGAFNVSDGHPLRYREYFNLVAEIWGLPGIDQTNVDESGSSVSPAMQSYLRESRRIDNSRLLESFSIELTYPHPRQGLIACYEQE